MKHASAPLAFHEWPLVLFTTLATMGAGLLATPFIAWLSGQPPSATEPVFWWGVLLVAAGMGISQAHLGKPWRAPLSARGLGTSRLSAEIVLLVALLLVGTLAAWRSHATELLPAASALLALAFLLALGFVYALRGQTMWRGAAMFAPLTLGLGFGALTLAAVWDGAILAVGSIASIVLAADMALLIVRRLGILWPREPIVPVHPHLFARRQELLTARFIFADVLPGLLIFGGLATAAATSLAIGLLLDRVAFYALAAQHTTEAEIGAVEGRI